MEKHNSCLNSRAIIEYVEEKAPERISELFQDLGPEMDSVSNPRAFLSDPNNWISSELLLKLFKRARLILDDPDAAFKIGYNSIMNQRMGYLQKIILYAFGNPYKIMQRIQKVNDHLNKTKTVELIESSPNSSVVRLHWKRDIPLSRDFCLYNKGIYQAVPAIWGAPSAQLEETKSFFDGDEYCEYHVKWRGHNKFKSLLFKVFAPWKLVRETIRELEHDKEVLKQKYSKIHELNQQLEHKVVQLTTLQESSTAILSTIKLEELLELILSKLTEVANLDRAGIFLTDEKRKSLVLIYAVGIEKEIVAQFKGYHIRIGRMDNIISRSAESREPVLVDDVKQFSLNPENPLLKVLRPKAFILVPLTVRGRTVGIMVGDNSRDEKFIKTIDKNFLKSFANHIAMALENATLYEKLKESEQKYREIVENVNEGIWILDEDGGIRYANRRLVDMLGGQELKGINIYSLVDEEGKRVLLKVLMENVNGHLAKEEVILKGPSQIRKSVLLSSVPLSSEGKYAGCLAIVTDLTYKKDMEKKLLQAQKLESVGTMAGGMAHDFNNILTGILGYTMLLQKEAAGDPKLTQYIEVIEKSSLRAADLVKKMLAFSRGSKPVETKPISVNDVIQDSMTLLKSSLSKDIDTKVELYEDLPLIVCDPTQVQQTILNLCLNARDAMPNGGTLKVSTDLVKAEEINREHGELLLNAGEYVRIQVCDTGTGMDEETKERIFDPFFTTKEIGKGSGLGLAMVYGIVQGIGGHITVDSEVGKGTTFEILLPVSFQEKVTLVEQAKQMGDFSGSETLLVVDDEEIVRDLAKEILSSLGYKILLAKDGLEAIHIYRAFGQSIDLVIMDLLMPGLDGKDTYLRLKEMDSQVKVLFCSGRDSLSLSRETDPVLKDLPFTAKPFNINELPKKLRQILD